MKHKKWKVLSRQDVSPSKWFPIVKEKVELPSGKKIDYFKSTLVDVVMVIVITKQNEVVFVKQYKHGIGEVCLEFPAGRIESGKTAKQAVVDELKEETGIKVEEDSLIELIELWTEPSKSTIRVQGFLVLGAELGGEQELEETEQIEVVKVPISKLSNLLRSGELHGSDTLALLSYAKEKYPQYFN